MGVKIFTQCEKKAATKSIMAANVYVPESRQAKDIVGVNVIRVPMDSIIHTLAFFLAPISAKAALPSQASVLY